MPSVLPASSFLLIADGGSNLFVFHRDGANEKKVFACERHGEVEGCSCVRRA